MHMGGMVSGMLQNARQNAELAEAAEIMLRELEKLAETRKYRPKGDVARAMSNARQILRGGF